MKRFIILLCMVATVAATAQIRVNLGTNSVTGKKMKATLTSYCGDGIGAWARFTYTLKNYENDNTTETPVTGTLAQQEALKEREYAFEIVGKFINPSTRILTTADDVSGLTLQAYLNSKVINTYPNLAGGDTASKFTESYFKELITILQLNSVLP